MSAFLILNLQAQGPECIAVTEIMVLHAASEPLRALRAGAVRKFLRTDLPLRDLLQMIIADRLGGIDRLFDIARVKVAFLLHIVRKHSGQIIRMQFQRDRVFFRVRLTHLLLQLMNMHQQPRLVLHVVADFVRQHVGHRKIAALTAEFAL